MNKYKILLHVLKERGLLRFWKLICHMFNVRVRSLLNPSDCKEILKHFNNKSGLEIGGPSNFFNNKGCLPIYSIVKSLDNINFSSSTVWTGLIQEDEFKINNKALGKQYILDATDLKKLDKENYDFILSSNNLEHIANPLLAISQWLRVIKPNGLLLIMVPRKESNFDHLRKVVELCHLKKDFKDNIGEDDLFHMGEIVRYHDLDLDPMGGTWQDFRKRSLKNYKNRCLHHHVFDNKILEEIFNYFNINIINQTTLYSDYIILGEKMVTSTDRLN